MTSGQIKYNFNQAVGIALTCVAPKGDIKQNLTGVYCDPAGFVVSTDGIVMAVIKTDVPTEFVGKILSASYAKALVKGKDEPVVLINGGYADWRRAFPKNISDDNATGAAFSPFVLGQVLNFTKAVMSIFDKKVAKNADKLLPIKLLPTQDSCLQSHVLQIGDAVMVVMPLQRYADPTFDTSFLD